MKSNVPLKPPSGYRPCVGVALFNADGLVFMGCRSDQSENNPYRWQLPQGGIDKGEDPEAAARRELFEETGIQSVKLIGSMESWVTYDFPEGVLGKRFKKYRGQAQLWYAYKFVGDDPRLIYCSLTHPSFSNGTGSRLNASQR